MGMTVIRGSTGRARRLLAACCHLYTGRCSKFELVRQDPDDWLGDILGKTQNQYLIEINQISIKVL